MSRIGFIGVGNMGTPMVLNLLFANHTVKVFDLNPKNYVEVEKQGAILCDDLHAVVNEVDYVITMLPAGEHSEEVYFGTNGIFESTDKSVILLECSTIDIATVKKLHHAAKEKGFTLFDAPVSGGTTGAHAATLTFMIGGDETKLSAIKPLLSLMGKNIFYAGEAGSGQAAKICNNLMLAVHMIGTAEGLSLGKALGLNLNRLYDICNHASGQSWSLTNYCPMPDIMPNVPSSHDFKPGFMAKMMLKDLKLAEEAVHDSNIDFAMMKKALSLYQQFCEDENAELDFSAIIKKYDIETRIE